MDFDFTTETITPDATTILTIGGSGALELPSGPTAFEPGTAIAGAIRWNTDQTWLEYFNGSLWKNFSGSVTSVAVTGSNGITVGGSPITSSGTITLTLGAITPTSVVTGAITGTSITDSGLTANSFVYPGAGGLLTSTAAATNGQILIGGTGAPAAATISISGVGISVTNGNNSITLANTGVTSNVAGTGISVSGATGAVTISNTGVLSITGTANQVIASAATGAVTLSLPQSINTTATPTFNQVTITNQPVAATDTVNLSYLQAVIAGLEWKQEAAAATTTNLSTTYANGSGGVGATLTDSSAGSVLVVDGVTIGTVGQRVLVKNQTSQLQNGIYQLTTAGVAGTTPYVLTRTTDANTSTALNNATLFITQGTVNGNSSWTQTTANPTVGTSNIVFVQNSGSGTYTAGTGLTLTGNVFSLTSPVSPSLGGTGTTTAPTTGQVLVGTAGGVYAPATITSSTGISTTTGSGTLQINNTGVTSAVAGTNITVSSATGAVTIATTPTPTFTSITDSGLTANSFLYSGTGGLLTTTSAPTNGQLLIGSTGSAPVAATLTQGTGITIANTAGAITISNSGVTSFQTSLSGLTPSSSTTGAITLAGTLGLTSGGTGASLTDVPGAVVYGGATAMAFSAVGTSGYFLTSGGTGAPTWSNPATSVVTSISAGTGISVSGGTGAVTISNTGVLSISGGTTGLTPNTATTGAITLAGTLVVANGGTGATTLTTNGVLIGNGTSAISATAVGSLGQVLAGNTGAAPTFQTLSSLAVTTFSLNDTSTTAIYTTTPTSASTGAVASTITLKSQTANTVFAAPNGSTGQPSFRVLTKADIISGTTGALQLYNENPSTPTQPTVAGTNAVAIGTGAAAANTNGFAVGSGTSTTIYGARAYANGNFATAGDSQALDFVYRQITTNNSVIEMFLDGATATQRAILPNNSAWTFSIRIACRRTDAVGSIGSWIFTGCIYKDGTAASTTMVGLSKQTNARVGTITTTNDPIVSADTTNGSLKIVVTGVTSQTFRWVADCELVQVTN